MPLKDWHPGKIGLIWALPLIFLLLLIGTSIQADDNVVLTYASLWTLTTGIAWAVTWKWLSGRDTYRKTKAKE